MSDDFTPLSCKWCYWENHVTTDESCVCLVDVCKTGNPQAAFALACDDYNEGCPCNEYMKEGGDD